MSDALTGLGSVKDPNLLVGIETADDAAVYRLTDEIAMINTVDFITPPVDDPYWFGQIAAANSISDVYSMGGRPLTALSLVMFPSEHLDIGVLREILRGGHEKVAEAGACLAGGHTVDDEEPKYGLSVSGIVHPDRVVTNAGARSGDILVLTKPLGTGVLFNAVRSGKFPYRDLERDILPSVAELNADAMQIALAFGVHACTDVTGFGIAGHLLEVAKGSGAKALLTYSDLPLYSGSLDMYAKGETTGSNSQNRKMCVGHLQIDTDLTETEEEILYDPQTSGGLLLCIPADQVDQLLGELSRAGVEHAVRVGEIVEGEPGVVVV